MSRIRQIVQVTVVESDLDDSGGRKKEGVKQAQKKAGRNAPQQSPLASASKSREKRQHSQRAVEADREDRGSMSSPSFIEPFVPMPPTDDPLPDDQTSSLYLASNAVGSPPGKTVAGARVHAAATSGTENPGSENFTFGIPVAFLPGRGLDVSVPLVHNSQLWNKYEGVHTLMTYNVDSGWPAPGWRLGYGQIEDQGSAGFTLTDADGTRHALVYYGSNNWETTDGTFIRYTGGSGGPRAITSTGVSYVCPQWSRYFLAARRPLPRGSTMNMTTTAAVTHT